MENVCMTNYFDALAESIVQSSGGKVVVSSQEVYNAVYGENILSAAGDATVVMF